jgi:signal transduction histidine kinase
MRARSSAPPPSPRTSEFLRATLRTADIEFQSEIQRRSSRAWSCSGRRRRRCGDDGRRRRVDASLRAFLSDRAEEAAAWRKFSFLTVGGARGPRRARPVATLETSLDEKDRWRIYLVVYAAALLLGVGYLGSRVVATQAALREANEELERRVAARTADLEKALHQLKDSEAALVQSEKMSSLGQLVAGVAHEINTPLAYVKNSMAVVRERLPRCAYRSRRGREPPGPRRAHQGRAARHRADHRAGREPQELLAHRPQQGGELQRERGRARHAAHRPAFAAQGGRGAGPG